MIDKVGKKVVGLSLKSVDLQTAIPKSTEVAKVKQIEERDAGNRQQQLATEFQRRVERRQQQVTSSPHLRESRVDPDGRGAGRSAGRGPGRGPDQQAGRQARGDGRTGPDESPPGPPPESGKGKRLDITI